MEQQFTQQIMQTTGFNPKPIDFAWYFKVIWQKKYWIVLISILVTIIWYFIYSIFLDKPEYTSDAVIRFSDPSLSNGIAAVTDFGVMDAQGKIAVLTTNSFLGRVVDSLNYCIIVKNEDINPAELIEKVETKTDNSYGAYKQAKRLKG